VEMPRLDKALVTNYYVNIRLLMMMKREHQLILLCFSPYASASHFMRFLSGFLTSQGQISSDGQAALLNASTLKTVGSAVYECV